MQTLSAIHIEAKMNTLVLKYRERRDSQRRARAIARAIERCPSRAMREELMAIASRY